MTRLTIVAALVLITSLTGGAQSLSRSIKIGSPAPTFSTAALDGTRYDLAQLHGAVVVMTFWSTHCPICQAEIPKLNQLVRKYDRSKVQFLSLTAENENIVASYLSAFPLSATVLPNSFGVLLQYADRDRDGNVNIAYPAYFVVDRSGLVQYRGNGYDKTPALAATVDRLIAK